MQLKQLIKSFSSLFFEPESLKCLLHIPIKKNPRMNGEGPGGGQLI